jgi:hypothetical protein
VRVVGDLVFSYGLFKVSWGPILSTSPCPDPLVSDDLVSAYSFLLQTLCLQGPLIMSITQHVAKLNEKINLFKEEMRQF